MSYTVVSNWYITNGIEDRHWDRNPSHHKLRESFQKIASDALKKGLRKPDELFTTYLKEEFNLIQVYDEHEMHQSILIFENESDFLSFALKYL